MVGSLHQTRAQSVQQRVLALVKVHRVLIANAGSVTVGSLASAILGFAFWWCTARIVPAETQGLAAASVAAMNLLAFTGEFGFHTLLLGLSLDYTRDGRLISAAIVTGLHITIVISVVFLLASANFAQHIQTVVGSTSGAALFLFGAGVTSVVITVDGAILGLLRGATRMLRELIFSSLRLVLVLIAGAGAIALDAKSVLAIWIAALFASLVFVAAVTMTHHRLPGRPDFARLANLVPDVLAHHLLNLGAVGPFIALPFLVSEILSPEINAVFYAAWMLLQALLLVPSAIAITVFAVGSADEGAASERLRLSLLASTLIGVCAGLCCYLVLDDLLALFNPTYPAVGGPSLRYLGLSLVPIGVRYHYVATMRLRKQLMRAAGVIGLGAIADLAAATIGGLVWGLPGLVAMWMLSVSVQAAIMLPTILLATRATCPQQTRSEQPGTSR